MHTANLVLLLLIAVAVPVTHAQFDFNFDNPFGGLFDDFYSDGSNPDDYSYGYSQNGFSFGGSEYSTWDKSSYFWSSSFSYFYSSGFGADFFPSEGEILPGVTFSDAMNTLGKAMNKGNIRKSMASLCNDMEGILGEFLEDSEDICEYITQVAENDEAIEGLTDLCLSIELPDSYDSYSWGDSWNHQYDWLEGEHWVDKRSVNGEVVSRNKRAIFLNDNDEESVSYLERLLFDSVAEEFGIDNKTNVVACQAIGHHIINGNKNMSAAFRDIIYYATAVIVEVGFKYCTRNDSSVYSGRSDEFDGVTETPSYSNSASDYSYSASDSDEYSGSSKGFSDYSYWYEETEYFLSDVDIIGVLAQTVLGDYNTSQSCDRLFTANETGSLEIFRQEMTDGAIQMLTDYDQCVSNFMISNETNGPVITFYFGSTNYTEICAALVRSSVEPEEEVKLELDLFWFYDENWWDYYSWNDDYSGSNDYSSNSWIGDYSEKSDYSWSEDYSWSDGYSWYNDSGDYSWQYDIWNGYELDWMFTFELLSPHITPTSWLSVLGKLYNAGNASDAFVDFCYALPDELYVFQMEEMCDGILSGDIDAWFESCYQLGADGSGDGFEEDWDEDWVYWDLYGFFDWYDEWEEWRDPYYNGWRWDYNLYDLSWVILEPVAEVFGVNDLNEEDTCKKIGRQMERRGKAMNETIIDILHLWAAKTAGIGLTYCKQTEDYDGDYSLSVSDDGSDSFNAYSASWSWWLSWENSLWDDWSDGWGGNWDDYHWGHDNTYFSDMDILGLTVSTLRGDPHPRDSCSDIITYYRNESLDIFNQSLVDGVLNILGNQTLCFVNFNITQYYHPGFLETFFRSDDVTDVCNMLTRAFTDPDDLELEMDFFWFFQQDSYSEDSISWLDYANYWTEDFDDVNWIVVFDFLAPHITPESWISLLGNTYNARNLSAAFLDFCSALPDELYDFEMKEMCVAVSQGNYYEWQYSCEELAYGWWRKDLWDWDYGSDSYSWNDGSDSYSWNDWYSWDSWSSDGYDYSDEYDWGTYEVENFLRGLYFALEYSMEVIHGDVYDMCDFGGEFLDADNEEYNAKFDEILGNISIYLMHWAHGSIGCSQSDYYSDSFSFSDINWWIQEDMVLYNAISGVVLGLGRYESGEDFCTDYEEHSSEIDVMGRQFVANFYKITTSKTKCVKYFETIESFISDATAEMYGYSSFSNLCTYIVDTFEDSDIDLEEPDLDEEEIPLAFIIGIMAKLKSRDYVIDVATEVCDDYAGILSFAFSEREAVDICSSVRDSDITSLVSQCEEALVPLIYGDDFPVGLKPFPEDQFINAMMTGLFGIDLNDVSDETPCEVLETVVNGDKGLIELAEDTLDLALGELIPWLGGVCEGRDFIINEMFYGDDEYSYSWYNWNSYSTEEEFISLEDVDVMVGIITGKGSVAGVCDDIIQATNRGEQAVQSLAVDLREALFSIITNPGRCRLLVSSVNDKAKEVLPISADEESSELLEEFTWLTGYTTVDGFCEALVAAMTQEEVEECRGIEDCAGVCNGDATRDCAGVCNGAADHDCAGQCNGAAYINNCTECVGGRTGRPWYFGADRCGNCKAFKGYYEAWDCYGTCDGTAYRDRCGTCIGGSTGRDETFNEDRLDCRSICDGAWEEDTCGFCEPASFVSYVGGSKYMDCSSTCVTPGFSRATENDCGECVGGSSGLDSDYGYNVCGQCEADPDADETSCQGCDGIPNSGQVFDTCGVCGGDGSNCVGVGTVVPDYIPNRSVLVTVFGAGFTADSELTCVFYDEDGVKTEGEVVDRWSNVVIICEADLSPGEYEVGVKRDSDNPNNIRANIKVYEDVTVTSFTPTEVDIDPSLSEQEFNITIVVSGSPFTAMESETDYSVIPSLIIEDASGSTFVYYGEFISANEFIVPIQMPRVSGQYTLSPSVNHVHGLGTKTYTGTIYYPAPSMEEAKFSDTGAALVVYFDLSVEFRTMTGCDDIFDDVSGLGAGAGCYAIGTKVLVVLFGKYDGTTLLTPGDTLTLKSNSVKSFNQEYSRSGTGSETIQSADSPPQVTALLSGPETLPSCGYVKMDGRKSTGSGARALTYVWSVSSSGSTSAVDSILASINAENSNNGAAAVEFDGADMDANKPYEFTMSVTNFLGESDSTSLTITRSGVAAPEVKVIVEGTDADAALIADSFGLTAEVKYYSACVAAGETQFQWSVNNSDVPLNLKTMYTRRLYVPANTLPGGEALEFTVRVFKSSNVSAYVETTVTVVTIQSDLIAVIDGGQEFTVGRDSGNLVLNAGNSIDPDEEARAWEYEWQCLQNTDNSACWSFNPDTVGYLIINDTNIGDSQLSFDALSLEADKEYIFTVTVRKNDRSAFTSVTISAVDGNPPKILLESDDEDAIVNDDEYVIFSATITHESDIDNIQWETADTDLGYGYIDFDDESNMLFSPLSYSLFSGSTLALVGIQKGVVSRGTEYAITVTVETTDGQNSTAKAYLTVRSGPTSCDFTVPDHEELDEVVFLMENCVTSADAYPLSFQLFVEKSDGSYEAVTEKKSEPSINGIGKPKLDSSDTRTYLMNVCDRNDMCTEYDVTATVTEKSSFSEAEISDFKANNVDAKKYAGDTLGALTNRNMLPDAGSEESSRRRRAAETTSDVVTEQLELVQLTIANSVLDSSSVSALIDQIESISTDDMNLEDQSTFLGYLEDVINVYLDEGTAISTSAATILLGKCSDIAYNLDTLYNANILDLTRIVQMAVAESMTSDLSVGAPSIEINNADKVTTVQKTILSGSFGSKSTGDVISIDFGSELSSLYGASWSCGSDTCSGVSLTVTHYDSTYDYFSTDSSDISTYRMCDVITIEIANPDTGQQLNVSDLTSPIMIGFPITRNVQSVTPSCVYWDDAMGEWSTDGMTVSAESSTEITCESDHLTTFSVVGIPIPTTESSYDYGEDDYDISDLVDGIVQVIIWVVVGILVVFVLIVVLIILIVVVIFTMTHTKKAPANPRVTQPQPQPQPIQMQHVQPTHTVQIAPVAQPGYYPSAAPPYGAPLPPPPSYSMANPYAGLSSSSQPPPPSVTLVAPSGNLVKQDLYAGKDDAKSQGGGYSDYMSAVTSGLPGIDGGVPFHSTDPAVNGSMPGVEMSNVTPRNVNSAGGSHVSLTRHE